MESLVSCLCVSNNRANFLKNSIKCFLAQVYESKEMIIVSSTFDEQYQRIIDSYSSPRLRYFVSQENRELTLGELRNFSISKASGEYLCIWDDDDWHHCRRLELQVAEMKMKGKSGSILAYCLVHDYKNNQSYMSHPFFHPATLLIQRNLVDSDTKYPSLNLEEDLVFLKKLNARNALTPIVDPSLYIYVYHGNNAWNAAHFDRLFDASIKLSLKTSGLIKSVIDFEYSPSEASELLRVPSFLSELDYLGWFV